MEIEFTDINELNIPKLTRALQRLDYKGTMNWKWPTLRLDSLKAGADLTPIINAVKKYATDF